jgi:hypothetical protein
MRKMRRYHGLETRPLTSYFHYEIMALQVRSLAKCSRNYGREISDLVYIDFVPSLLSDTFAD